MNPISRCLLILLIITATLTGCRERDKTPQREGLRWSPTVGDTRHLMLTTHRKITLKVLNREEKLKESLGLLYLFTVESVDPDGDIVTRVKFEAVEFARESAIGKNSYSSSDPALIPDSETRRYANLVGESFIIRISPQWEITAVEGLEELEKKMLAKEKANQIVTGSMFASFQDNASMVAVRETLELALGVLPPGFVESGSVWEGESVSAANFPSLVRTRYELVVEDGKSARISLKRTISNNPEGGDLSLAVSVDLRGEGEGEMELDPATGWPIKGAIREGITGTIDSPLLGSVNKDAARIPFTMELLTIVESFD